MGTTYESFVRDGSKDSIVLYYDKANTNFLQDYKEIAASMLEGSNGRYAFGLINYKENEIKRVHFQDGL